MMKVLKMQSGAFALVAGVLLIAGCGKKGLVNPTNPNSEDYRAPRITTISIEENDTLKSDRATFSWAGNYGICEFSYRVDSASWSPWRDANTAAELLEDGEHTLEIQVRYEDQDDITSRKVTFFVDALDSGSLFFRPRKREAADNGAPVEFTLCTKAVEAITGMELILSGGALDSVAFTAELSQAAMDPLFAGNKIDFILDPHSDPVQGDMSVLHCFVKPDDSKDTTWVEVHSYKLRTSANDSIVPAGVQKAFIVK